MSDCEDREKEIQEAGDRDGAQPWGSYDLHHGAVSELLRDTATKEHENAIYNDAFHKSLALK